VARRMDTFEKNEGRVRVRQNKADHETINVHIANRRYREARELARKSDYPEFTEKMLKLVDARETDNPPITEQSVLDKLNAMAHSLDPKVKAEFSRMSLNEYPGLHEDGPGNGGRLAMFQRLQQAIIEGKDTIETVTGRSHKQVTDGWILAHLTPAGAKVVGKKSRARAEAFTQAFDIAVRDKEMQPGQGPLTPVELQDTADEVGMNMLRNDQTSGWLGAKQIHAFEASIENIPASDKQRIRSKLQQRATFAEGGVVSDEQIFDVWMWEAEQRSADE